MTEKKFNLGNVGLVVASMVFCLILLFVAEFMTRQFTDIPLLGGEKHLFERDKIGESRGLAENAEGVFYGIRVYTDSLGFRVSKDHQGKEYDGDNREAILIRSDSVGFGNGVEEDETFTGILKRLHSEKLIHNTSVPGHDLVDHVEVVRALQERIPRLDSVVLVYCLNDIYDVSSREIERQLIQAKKYETSGWIEKLAIKISYSPFYTVHVWLRRNSKFYLMLRDLLRDQQERYWKSIFHHYAVDDEEFIEKLSPFNDIADMLENKGMKFKVFISPYAKQMKSEEPGIRIPQSRVVDYLSTQGIDHYDMFDDFNNAQDPKKLFLRTDPMHLSPQGHRLVVSIIESELAW